MRGTDPHVVKRGEGWAVRRAGDSGPTSRHDTLGEAIDAARQMARRRDSQIVIHAPAEGAGSTGESVTPFSRRRTGAV